ncbi:MAG TPA: YbjQ family protein [Ktedonobacterales bacterium]
MGQQYQQQGATATGQQRGVAFDHSLVTGAFELPNHTITRNFGIVRGIVVRSRSIVGSIGAGLQQIVGGNISLYTEMCERARGEAYELMIQHAAAMGANGIISVRYDATEISPGVTEVLCYGTAVYVMPQQ